MLCSKFSIFQLPSLISYFCLHCPFSRIAYLETCISKTRKRVGWYCIAGENLSIIFNLVCMPSSEQYAFSTGWKDNYEHSSELAQGQSRCVKIFNPLGYNYNVVKVRTRKNHNKYTRPPTLKPHAAEGLEYSLIIQFCNVRLVHWLPRHLASETITIRLGSHNTNELISLSDNFLIDL